jgi:hypothetical protein
LRVKHLARNKRLHIGGGHGDEEDQEHEGGVQPQMACDGVRARSTYMKSWKRISWMKDPIQ